MPTIQIPEALSQRMLHAAEQQGVPVEELVEHVLNSYLDQLDRQALLPQDALVQLAHAAAAEYLAGGGQPMTPQMLEREVASRRGGALLLESF